MHLRQSRRLIHYGTKAWAINRPTCIPRPKTGMVNGDANLVDATCTIYLACRDSPLWIAFQDLTL